MLSKEVFGVHKISSQHKQRNISVMTTENRGRLGLMVSNLLLVTDSQIASNMQQETQEIIKRWDYMENFNSNTRSVHFFWQTV